MNWIIIDWANNLMFQGKEFETFKDGWSYIYRMFPEDESDIDDFYVIKSYEYTGNSIYFRGAK